VSIVLGVGLALLAVPAFETLVDRSLDPGILTSAPGLAALFASWLAVGLLASAYPVGVLSGFRPLAALREHASLKEQPQLVASLVVIQFVLAMVLVAGTFVMWDQFALLQEKNLGFNSERVVQIDGSLLEGRTSDTVRQRFVDLARSETAIQQATGAWQSFAMEGSLPNRFEATSAGQTIRSHAYRIAPHFADTFDLTVVAGRFLSPDRAADRNGAVVVNQAFVDAMGWDEPLGRSVSVQFQVRDAEVVAWSKTSIFSRCGRPSGPW
jgi:putative ABC transport system permease protein